MSPRDLAKLDALPTLPAAVQRIFQVLNDKDAPLSAVAEALAQDPGTTARIIGAANSAFFISHQAVYSVDDAAVRLGLNRIRILATSTLLASRFRPEHCPAFDQSRFWHQAMSVALCASKLANYVPLETPSGAAYLAGLLHNIGILVNAYAFPEAMNQALLTYGRADNDRPLGVLEQDLLGFNHLESGAAVLKRWDVPQSVVEAVGRWGEPESSRLVPRLAGLVRVCRQWYRSGYMQPPDCELMRVLGERKASNIANSCRREDEQLMVFAQSIAA